MADVKIYHNPRCSKSRQTLQLLQDHGIAVEVIEYLKTPLTAAQLEQLATQLGCSSARDFMRTKEDIYKELGLAQVDDEAQLFARMAAHPKLMERPIVVTANGAKIGRPPEAVLSLFN